MRYVLTRKGVLAPASLTTWRAEKRAPAVITESKVLTASGEIWDRDKKKDRKRRTPAAPLIYQPTSELIVRPGFGGIVGPREGRLRVFSRPYQNRGGGGGSTGGGGSVGGVSSLSRDIASNAGGCSITATCTSVVGTPPVTVNGVSATVTGTTGTSVTFTVPASGTTGLVPVVIGGFSAPNTFEYGPAPTGAAFFAWSDNASSITPYSYSAVPGGTVSISTLQALPGTTHSIQGVYANNGVDGGVQLQSPTFTLSSATHPNGVWLREYKYMSSASIANLGAQMKWHLCRRDAGSGQPGWYMFGQGSDFAISGSTVNVAIGTDFDTFVTLATTSGVNPADQWVEFICWYRWNVGSSNGSMRTWFGGKLISSATLTNASVGSVNTDYRHYVNQVFIKAPVGTITTYSANLWGGDGVPDPQITA